jgi:hypothetical protein
VLSARGHDARGSLKRDIRVEPEAEYTEPWWQTEPNSASSASDRSPASGDTSDLIRTGTSSALRYAWVSLAQSTPSNSRPAKGSVPAVISVTDISKHDRAHGLPSDPDVIAKISARSAPAQLSSVSCCLNRPAGRPGHHEL